MPQDYSTQMIILLVVIGVAGVATSLWRISRGGIQALGGVASLVVLGGVLVVMIFVMLQFQQVSNAGNFSGPGTPSHLDYTPIPWSTVSGLSTPTAPGVFI